MRSFVNGDCIALGSITHEDLVLILELISDAFLFLD